MEQALTVTLEQRVIKIQFYLHQTAQNIIEIGKELTAAKKEVGHGNWQSWLADNFKLTERTAQNFMAIAERFGDSKTKSISYFNSTQLITMLALPEGETENFIAAKAAEGKKVEDMTVKTLREEVAKYKADYEAEKAKVENLFAEFDEQKQKFEKQNNELAKDNGRLKAKFDAADKLVARYHSERDILKSQLENQKPMVVEPPDYQQLKNSQAQLQNKINALQKNLNNKTVEVVTPADYESTKKELAKLQQLHSKVIESATVSQKLSTIALMIEDVVLSKTDTGILEYKKNFPDSFRKLCDFWKDFLEEYDNDY